MEFLVEIISIGNELLIGKILNKNAQWLARRITRLGGRVRRISVVDDALDEIASALRDALERTPALIITTGGLGPTFDDMTLEGIAKALGITLNINEQAFELVKEKYRQYGTAGKRIELTPARVKMATLPHRAQPIQNPIGTAPGVLLLMGKTRIVVLPGVPKEMKAMFQNSIRSLIRELVGNTFIYERSLKVAGIMESTIAPLINEVMRGNPSVYVKSHPKTSEFNPLIELHLITVSKSKESAKKRVITASKQISKLILEHGGKIGR